jgi:ABC-2 type transport system ATP-binding protein
MTDLPIEIHGLSASYGKRTIFSGLDLTVAPGEIFGLIGLNGVGKTTLIKALLGLGGGQGDVRMFGQSTKETASRAKLAYLPEKFLPSHLLKGWEFLALTLSYYGLSLDRERAAEMARQLDFDPAALNRQGRTYSKGMGQKLGLIGTMLTGLPLLILDEPMSGLDPRARILLKDRLLEYRDSGNTVFFSSHILADIEEICDRIAIMHGGRLIYLGKPADLVARFGALNLERAFLDAIGESEREAVAAE